MHTLPGGQMLLDKLGLRMTIGGSCTATACGAAAASESIAPTAIPLAEIGMVLGILFGAVGVVIQVVRWYEERKVMRAELALIEARRQQEREEHEARMVAGEFERCRELEQMQ